MAKAGGTEAGRLADERLDEVAVEQAVLLVRGCARVRAPVPRWHEMFAKAMSAGLPRHRAL